MRYIELSLEFSIKMVMKKSTVSSKPPLLSSKRVKRSSYSGLQKKCLTCAFLDKVFR